MTDTAPGAYFRNERREIEPLLPSSIGRALELGCGTGETMRWIRRSRPVGYAAAIELMESAAVLAREVFDQVVSGDALASLDAIEGADFDLVLALDVLEHLPDPAEMVRRLRRRVGPAGHIVASLPHIGHVSVALPLLLRGRWEYADEGLLDRTHLRFFSERSARALFDQNGFAVERILYVHSFPNLFASLGVPGPRGRWYSAKLLDWEPLRRTHWFKFQFLVEARAA